MSVALIHPNKRLFFSYVCPATCKIRVTVESTGPVNLYFPHSSQVLKGMLIKPGEMEKIFKLQSQEKVENFPIVFPTTWVGTTWYLAIGNATDTSVAVHYEVFSA